LLLDGKVRKIDAGKIEDKYFFIVAGMGFDAVVGKLFDDQSLRGPLPYFTIGFREFLFYRPEVFTLRFDDKQVKVKALLVAIANTKQWGNGAIIAPRAEPDDGLLDICVIRKVGFLQALIHLPKIFTGRIENVHKYYQYFKSKSVQVVRQSSGPFHTDGEPNEGKKVLNVSIIPKALKLLVPGENTKSKGFIGQTIKNMVK
jgi:diacylglycerol kinase family enzyme